MKKIYIPSNLDLTTLIGVDSQNELDKYHFFINLIYEQKVLYRTNDDYVPLKAVYLRRIIRNYNRYLNELMDYHIICCDGYYIKGRKCFGYKLLPPYSEVRTKQIELKNPTILDNLKTWKNQRLPTTEVHLHLYKFLQAIEINYSAALNYINECLQNDIQEYNSAKIAIDKFLHKDFFLYSDDYGRIHTNVTNLKSSLRRFLYYQDKPLVNIDIVNSQPLFLLLLPPFHTIRCTNDTSPSDVRSYKSLVEQGNLYDFLMEKLGEGNRKKFKEQLFRETFFGRKVSKLFWELFPSVAKVLAEIKKDDYRSLAWMMQRAESNLIINKICRRVMETYGDECFIATIHDSILTTEEHVSKIEDIFREEFKNLGLLPSIRIEAA